MECQLLGRYHQACPLCKKHWKPVAEQIKGPLPDTRINAPDQQAFSHAAVDYGGPFLTQQGRGRTAQKQYTCVFTCRHTGACHLELAYGLDSDSFLMAFNWFMDHHGKPSSWHQLTVQTLWQQSEICGKLTRIWI